MLDKEGTDGLETSPLDVEVNGTPMSVLLGQAVKLKSAQEKPLRKVFDSFPTFYQNSLFSGQDVVDIRALGFEERLEAADKLKVLGNSLAKDGKYVESVNQYEMALSAITWIGNKKNHSWKSEGIKDDFIEEKHDAALAIDQPSNETQKLQKLQVTEHLISVYNNIAIVSTKTEQFTNAIAACTCALRLDERNVKALYLRSKARFTPKSCSVAEEEMAIRDLMAARKIDPQNKTVAKELERIRSIRAKAKANDKEAFQGFLQNGNGFDKEDKHCSSEGGDNQDDISKVTSLCTGIWTVKNEIAEGRRHISFVKGLLLMMLILVVLFNTVSV